MGHSTTMRHLVGDPDRTERAAAVKFSRSTTVPPAARAATSTSAGSRGSTRGMPRSLWSLRHSARERLMPSR